MSGVHPRPASSTAPQPRPPKPRPPSPSVCREAWPGRLVTVFPPNFRTPSFLSLAGSLCV